MATRHERLIILGLGLAGYTAAIYAARAMLKPLIIQCRCAACVWRGVIGCFALSLLVIPVAHEFDSWATGKRDRAPRPSARRAQWGAKACVALERPSLILPTA